MILEGAQAGLNWEIILKKRQGYRYAFYNFDSVKIANMSDSELEALRDNPKYYP
ncbi:DNA-3-methyladenine glycosylase I [Francisella noatunensis]